MKNHSNGSPPARLMSALAPKKVWNRFVGLLASNPERPPSPPSLSINNVAVREGGTGTKDATFTVKLSAASTQTVTVRVNTAGDTATSNSDYNPIVNQTLSFAPGQTSKTVAVKVIGDTIDEPTERYFVRLSSATNAAIAD